MLSKQTWLPLITFCSICWNCRLFSAKQQPPEFFGLDTPEYAEMEAEFQYQNALNALVLRAVAFFNRIDHITRKAAVIFDVDGTVLNPRYQCSQLASKLPNRLILYHLAIPHMRWLCQHLNKCKFKIIFVTTRAELFEFGSMAGEITAATSANLQAEGFPIFKLICRPSEQQEPIAWKQATFYTLMKKYHIVAIFDDDPRVFEKVKFSNGTELFLVPSRYDFDTLKIPKSIDLDDVKE